MLGDSFVGFTLSEVMVMAQRVFSTMRRPSRKTSEFSSISDGEMFKSRPFVVQTKVGEERKKPDLRTSLMRAQRYGHQVSKINLSDFSAPQAVQSKIATRQPVQSQWAEALPMQLTPDPYEGLFPPGADSIPVKYYNQRQGHNGEAREWEHPVPGASYPGGNRNPLYRSAPVMGIPKSVHRNGQGGGGGGVSSTGSSSSAHNWASGLRGHVNSGNFAEALKKGLLDNINAAHVNDELSMDWAHAEIKLIDMHLQRNDINAAEAGDLRNFVMDAVYKRMESPRQYGGAN